MGNNTVGYPYARSRVASDAAHAAPCEGVRIWWAHPAGVVELPGAALVAAVLRWQNEQGRRMRQIFAMVSMDEGTVVEMNPKQVADWLTAPAEGGAGLPAASDTKRWLDVAQQAMERRIADVSNTDLHPENRQWTAAAWRGESTV